MGGKSYGLYQLSSDMGVVQDFIRHMGYSDRFDGLTVGSVNFDNQWIQAAFNSQFGKDQHEYIKRTHYNKQIDYLKENGIDLTNRGPAVQDMVWSTSVQFGGLTSLILKALKPALPLDNKTDCDIVALVQNYKISNNDRLFKSSSAKVRAGTLSRAKAELKALEDLANVELSSGDLLAFQLLISSMDDC